MLKDELDALKAKVFHSSQCFDEDFEILWRLSITEQFPTEERLTYLSTYSEIFWLLCLKYRNLETIGELVGKIGQFIDFVQTSEKVIQSGQSQFYNNKEDMFVHFLYWLRHRVDIYSGLGAVDSTKDFMEYYLKLHDVLDSVKWVFTLADDTGEKLFPIQRLLDDVATDFIPDEEHYLQLVFSLQLFNDVIDEKSDRETIRNKMLKIASEHNIKLINWLCSGGEILFGSSASLNSLLNGTIAVKNESHVLLRNVSPEYFNNIEVDKNYHGEKSYEGDDQEAPIAYYYEYPLNPDEMVVDFTYVMSKANCECRKELLFNICEKNIYNVFMKSSIIIDRDSNLFVKFVNPFADNDEAIIFEGKSIDGERPFDKFWNVLSNELSAYSMVALATHGPMDVLSLDFLTEFCINFGTPDYNYLADIGDSDDEYFQNRLFRAFIMHELGENKIFDAVGKYITFLNKFYKFDAVDEKTLFGSRNKLVLPYAPYVPFDGNIDSFFDALEANGYIYNGRKVRLEIKLLGRKKQYSVDGKSINPQNIVDFSADTIDESEIEAGLGLYVDESDTLYLLNDHGVLAKQLKGIQDIAQNAIVDVAWRDNCKRIDKIVTIMATIGFAKPGRVLGRRIAKPCEEEAFRHIALYKLLWHIQVFGFSDTRYEMFEKLVLDYYYTGWIFQADDINQRYFERLLDDEDQGRMIVAKESDGEGSTLDLLFEKYYDGSRGALRKAFDGTYIKKGYCEENNTYLDVPLTDIVFITDNALSGGSTTRMLDYYLNGIKKSRDKRTYFWEGEKNIIRDIFAKVDKPKPRVHVRTILCTKKAKQAIVDYFSAGNYDITVTEEIFLEDSNYACSQEIINMIDELYGDAPRPERALGNICLFRPCNMTAEAVLPEYVKRAELLVGLFQKKKG